MASLMTLVPQVMAAGGHITTFNTGGIPLLIIKMTFLAKARKAVHIVPSNYKYQSLSFSLSAFMCVYPPAYVFTEGSE